MKKFVALISVAVLALTACTQQDSHTVKILAHRGHASSGNQFSVDENTIEALKRAQAENFTGIEFDVHLTADNQIVVRHDNKIEQGLSCQGSTLEEIRAHRLPFGGQIPTLREWLEQAKQTPHIYSLLEVKSHKNYERELELVKLCVDMIRELDMVDQMYILSFKTSTLDEVQRLEPKLRTLYNSSSLHHSLTPDEVKERGYNAASYNINVILNHPEWIEQFRNHGIETFLWMVNSPYTYSIAKEFKFDWATTDFVEHITK